MKKCLLFTILFALSLTLYSQTNIWNGSGDGVNWGDASNWSLGLVPTGDHDVVIPTGFTVNLNVPGSTKSIAVQGNSTFNIFTNLIFTNASSFASNVTVNWSFGSLFGGGTLTNNGTFNLSSDNDKFILGLTTINNEGIFNILSGGDLFIDNDGVFNNQLSGTIDMQGVEGNITSIGELNNFGLIKKTTDGIARIQTVLNNNGGTITVSSGNLIFDSQAKNLNGGVYNVSEGSVLQWNTNTILSGTFTGNLMGEIAQTFNIIVPTSTTATFDFTGDGGVNWSFGSLFGGGTLVNKSLIISSSENGKSFSGSTTINNEGIFNILNGGDLSISDDSVFNNQSSGTIDMQGVEGNISSGDSSTSVSVILNNFGLIKRTTDGIARIETVLNNNGVIDVQSGNLVVSQIRPFTNAEDGTVKGVATVTIVNNAIYTNNGIFAPGGSPGTLTVVGNFESESTSVLEVELNGLTQGTQYDVLAITGTNAVFDGNVNVVMGFDAAVGNSFTIATVSGTITTKSLTTPIDAEFEGKRYTFDVSYPDDNAVLLTVSDRVDIQAPAIVVQNVTLQLDASGTTAITPAMVNNGTTDNCTLPENITFSLDTTTFNCSNLGANTVTLTATDETGNSSNTTSIVIVEDSINPTVTCGGDISVDSNGSFTLPNYIADSTVTATDNCSATIVQTPTEGTILEDGIHTIMFVATDGSGNSVTCSFDLEVSDTTLSIDDLGLTDANIVMFPNPTNGNFTIDLGKEYSNVSVQISNMLGQKIASYSYPSIKMIEQEISATSGIYFVAVSTSEGISKTMKIIKK